MARIKADGTTLRAVDGGLEVDGLEQERRRGRRQEPGQEPTLAGGQEATVGGQEATAGGQEAPTAGKPGQGGARMVGATIIGAAVSTVGGGCDFGRSSRGKGAGSIRRGRVHHQ